MPPKRHTSTTTNKKQSSAKQALKTHQQQKQKQRQKLSTSSSTKFRNDQLRENLDKQAQCLLMVQQPQQTISTPTQQHAVNDLLNSLVNL